MGNRVGRKAALWGAICGTLPDLDVLIPMANEVASYTYHRGFSHSLFVAAAVSPVLGWLIHRIPGHRSVDAWRWILLVWLALSTHPLLDAFTTYGTQLWWPMTAPPVAWNSIFIIDPLYTLPLAIGLLVTLLGRGDRRFANHLGLALSSIYLCWTLVAKSQIEAKVESQFGPVEDSSYMSTPTALNSLLWRVLIMDHDGYREGFVSIFDEPGSLKLRHYASGQVGQDEVGKLWSYQRLKWFTRGFMRVDESAGVIRITDLRMGQQDNYLFAFDIARRFGTDVQEQLLAQPSVPDFEIPDGAFSALWRRIGSPCPEPFESSWRALPLSNLFHCAQD